VAGPRKTIRRAPLHPHFEIFQTISLVSDRDVDSDQRLALSNCTSATRIILKRPSPESGFQVQIGKCAMLVQVV